MAEVEFQAHLRIGDVQHRRQEGHPEAVVGKKRNPLVVWFLVLITTLLFIPDVALGGEKFPCVILNPKIPLRNLRILKVGVRIPLFAERPDLFCCKQLPDIRPHKAPGPVSVFRRKRQLRPGMRFIRPVQNRRIHFQHFPGRDGCFDCPGRTGNVDFIEPVAGEPLSDGFRLPLSQGGQFVRIVDRIAVTDKE